MTMKRTKTPWMEADGFVVRLAAVDKPHGLRECHIIPPNGYIFVPSVGIQG